MAPCLRLLLLLLLPAGCAAPAEREAKALREAIASSQASLAAVRPISAIMPSPLQGVRTLALPDGPENRRPADAPPASAAELLGLGPEGLRHRLGEPVLRRAEGTAEIWLYTGPACALDLVLYRESGRLRVAHAAARASGAEPRTEAACLEEIAARAVSTVLPATAGVERSATLPDNGA